MWQFLWYMHYIFYTLTPIRNYCTICFPNLACRRYIYTHTRIKSVQFSHLVMSNSFQPYELQHVRLPCPSPTPRVYSNSCTLSWWCHPTISSSVIHFFSFLQSFPASGSFPKGQVLHIRWPKYWSFSFSASPFNKYSDWIFLNIPLGLTGWISLQSKGLSRVFSNTTVQKHQFFGAQLSL